MSIVTSIIIPLFDLDTRVLPAGNEERRKVGCRGRARCESFFKGAEGPTTRTHRHTDSFVIAGVTSDD